MKNALPQIRGRVFLSVRQFPFPGRRWTKIPTNDTAHISIDAASSDYHVIAKSKGLWQSPGTIHRFAQQKQTLYREIATPVCGLVRNDMVVGSHRTEQTFFVIVSD